AEAGENVGDRETGGRLNFAVGIDKRQVQAGRKPSPNCRFANPHQADQHDRPANWRGSGARGGGGAAFGAWARGRNTAAGTGAIHGGEGSGKSALLRPYFVFLFRREAACRVPASS